MSDLDLALVTALVHAARRLAATRSLEEAGEEVVRAATSAVPGFVSAALVVGDADGASAVVAASDETARALATYQLHLEQGPLALALDQARTVQTADTRRDPRWPRLARSLVVRATAPVAAQLCTPLVVGGRVLGALDLSAPVTGLPAEPWVRAAELHATQAAMVLERLQVEAQLASAVDSRTVIGQAVGLLMERLRVGRDEAVELLKQHSSISNTRVRTLADELVAEADELYGASPRAGDAAVPASPSALPRLR
ncbi:GAF and ANTAR domain-containing protein [Nocardioides nanhaiensis]|uniref:GAF and ANTAR domain-containing protein n=1 Tax=Nocardioides nanhaiensis TaxID=1476871 RepID=A0ABP8VUQ7_9ACTN